MSFEFRREGRVWLEYDSKFYLLHTTREVEFSQTFKQEAVAKKNLYNTSSVIEGSSITEANPANFSFTMFLVDETVKYQHIPLDLLIQRDSTNPEKYLNTFNLYFVYSDYSPEVYYKIENCMFTSGSFKIPRNGIMTVELSGEGSRLTRVSGSTPGSIYAGYDATPTYAVSKHFDVYLGGDTSEFKLDNILGVSFEVQNSISWTGNSTLQKSLAVTDASNSIYPESFTMESRSMSGSIQQYVSNSVDSSNENIQTWAENTTVNVKAGLSSTNYQFELTLTNNASFTNRTGFGEVMVQNYDFRLMDNPIIWSNTINY